MTCTCCFTCKWIYRPYYYVVTYALRVLVGVTLTAARFQNPRMRLDFPPDLRFSIPSSKGKRSIGVNMYMPVEGENKKCPVHINLYGSGFIFGSAYGLDAEFCRDVCRETGAIVLDCRYAIAPENPFPAAYEDVSDVVAHVLANVQGHYDTSRITIGGFSAGGTIALAVSATMPKNTFKAVTTFYPLTNLTLKNRRRIIPPPGQSELPVSLLQFYCNAYAPHSINHLDPRLSPHNSPAGAFPDKLVLVVCEYDPLRDEAIDLGTMLQEGGKDVEVINIAGASHGWDKIAEDGTEVGNRREMAYSRIIQVLGDAYR